MVSTFPSTPVQIELGEEEFYNLLLGHANDPGAAKITRGVFWWRLERTKRARESEIVVKGISGITRFFRVNSWKRNTDWMLLTLHENDEQS